MAEKRMLAKTIIESGAFYNLTPKAQCLYLHLSMNADDDGMLNNSKNIYRSLGFNKSVLQELIDNRFLLDMDDGIVCIKHWRINNTIAKDRYKPTIYQDKLQRLYIKENKAYTDKLQNDNNTISKCLQNDNSDKNRLDKNRIDKNSDDDIQIEAMVERAKYIGISDDDINEAFRYYNIPNYPKSADFFQRVLSCLTDYSIYDKDAYISQIARNMELKK